MSVKLTDSQLLMLSAASQRADRCLAALPSAKGAGAHKIVSKLVTTGLAKEVRAKLGAYVWRRDEATGHTYALKLTPAGLKAIAVEDESATEAEAPNTPPASNSLPTGVKGLESSTLSAAPTASAAAPRDGSKLATVIEMLRRDSGATIDQLAAATSWLPHTTRAALTALRKRGFVIDRCKAAGQRASAYAISDGPSAAQR